MLSAVMEEDDVQTVIASLADRLVNHDGYSMESLKSLWTCFESVIRKRIASSLSDSDNACLNQFHSRIDI